MKTFAFLAAILSGLAAPLAHATDYYIAPAGDDAASGTSEATPWKSLAKVNATTFLPGDNILFQKGGTWTGSLQPQGSGNSSAQITLGAYGEGAKPLIDGAGGGTAISLSGQSYWTIDGFEVTNQAGGTGGNRCGIRVGGGGDGSTISRIRILNNDVHDIQATPNVNDGARNWGGIFVWIDEPGKANEVLIQGNTVTEIQGQGISFWGEWENGPDAIMNYANCSPNVVVRENRVWRTSGDGILTLGTDNELVEYNEVAYAGALSGDGNNIAAAWPTRHRNGIWQYNHVHHTKWLNANDSTAFDNDGFVQGTTYFQYNYTHDNEGGFHMEYLWVADTGKTVSRYNVSVNDGRGTTARIYFSNRAGSELYNNVFYNPGMTLDVSNGGAGYHTFRNNIFVGAGRTASFATQGVYYNNTFNGGVTRPTSANNNVTRDPLFVSPNTIGNLAGFLLQSTSSERGSGAIIASNGGMDFWGVTLPGTAPHRGASQINVIGDYTATPTFIQASGPSTANIPLSGTYQVACSAAVRDQNFLLLSPQPTIAWSIVPAVSGLSIDSNGTLSIDSTVAPQRIAVVATSGALTRTWSLTLTNTGTFPLTWNNGASTGKWNASDVNWSGNPWIDGAQATFSHTATPQTVTLEGTRSASGMLVGNGGNNANYTFTSTAGASLATGSFLLQGNPGNDSTTMPVTTLDNADIAVSGNLGIGRAGLLVKGDSTLTAGTIGGNISGISSADWGYLTIQDTANVTATNGVTGNTTAWGINLNGGTLTTSGIQSCDFSYLGAYLYLNGGLLRANQNNPSFLTLFNGSKAYVGSGGAKIDTNGYNVGIGVPLVNAATASPSSNGGTTLSGTGSLVKQGSGTLTLSAANTYSGPTTISGGTLRLSVLGGAARHFDAASLGLANGAAVTQWNDLSGNAANATVPSGNATPTYLSDAGTGTSLGAVSFLKNNSAWDSQALGFPRDTAVRTVFSVFKGSGFLLTDSSSFDLHRPGDDNPADPLLIQYGQIDYLGTVRVNGSVVAPLADAMPTSLHNGFNLVSLVSNGNPLELDSFNKDRTYHAGTQAHAETILFDSVIDETRRQQIEAYLAKKWFDEGAGAGNLLPATAAVTLSNGGTLDLGGVNFQTFASISSTDGGGSQIMLGTAALTVGDSTSTTFDGAVSGFGSLVKQGSGTLTLSGNNSFSGGTTVNDGTLKIAGRDQLPGNGGITIGTGTTLLTDAPNDANTQDISSTITLNGGILAAGTGTPAQNFNGGNPVGPWGNYHLAPGASLQVGNNTTSTISAMLGVNGTGGYTPIQVNGGSTLHISGNITGVSYVSWGAFSKSGDGTLLLTGYNKATSQGMILSAGTVEFSNNSLPTNLRASGGPGGYSADIQGNATLRWAVGNTQDISFENGSAQIRISDGITATFDTNGNNVILATAFDLGVGQTGGIIKAGNGTLTLTAANSYTGTTTVNGGTLQLGNGTSPTNLADTSDVSVSVDAMLYLDYSGTDQIRSLWVDGLQMPPGIYSASSGFITGPGTLTVSSGPASTNYAAWSGRGVYNLTGGPSDDDDNDGIANLLEYVLGGNPRAVSNAILPTATASSGNLVFTFRRIASTTSDTTQTFQYGTNLSGWTDVSIIAGGIVGIQPNTPQTGTDTVTITLPKGTEPRIFGRLKVSTPPAPF